ncbi:MAG: hypothetical protein QM820_60245 [Minicystis sp.]
MRTAVTGARRCSRSIRIRERLAVEQLHHEEGITVVGPPGVEHAHHRRVIEARRGLRLAEQALRHLGRLALGAQDLDRHLHVEVEVMRDPHHAHAALVELPDELVLAGDLLPGRATQAERRAGAPNVRRTAGRVRHWATLSRSRSTVRAPLGRVEP